MTSIEDQVRKLPRLQKISLMETLWSDLSQEESQYYRIESDEVRIYRILDCRQDPTKVKKALAPRSTDSESHK